MTCIEQLIRQEANPFDTVTFRPGNFWQEKQDPTLNVDTIHQEVITEIEVLLDRVAKDDYTRTLMLCGEAGSGKSHLLGRLKQTLNPKAFFTYIGPWPDSDFIWRHILRQTVDSLLKVPDGQQESQLLLWLKSLSVFKQRNFIDWIVGDRQVFIRNLRKIYPSNIYNANEFFGVLYDLLNPELHPLACDWLRGDDLSEDDLEALRVKKAIDNEGAAQNILGNFGKISAETQPIVLCFDNLDNIPRLSEGFLDLQALFSVNSTIHNEHFKNFLIIISLVTNTWKRNKDRVQPADRARIDTTISLKPINLNQAEAIWKFRLTPLHQQANKPPASSIYPLNRQALEEKFPGGKTWPRNTLMLGRLLFQDHKAKKIDIPTEFRSLAINIDDCGTGSLPGSVADKMPGSVAGKMPGSVAGKMPGSVAGKMPGSVAGKMPGSVADKMPGSVAGKMPGSVAGKMPTLPDFSATLASFQLIWSQEFDKVQQKTSRIQQFSSIELTRMLQEALSALQLGAIQPKFIPSPTYAACSLSYQTLGKPEKIGVVWTEDPHMTTFYNVMNACQKAVQRKLCETLYLIRAEGIGRPDRKGNKIYTEIFVNSHHCRIEPDLTSVQYLATYHNLVNAACAGDLVVGSKIISLPELETFIHKSKVLRECLLLKKLGIFSKNDINIADIVVVPDKELQNKAKNFLLNIVEVNQFLGRKTLIEHVKKQFSQIKEPQVEELIQQLCQEHKIQIIDPRAKPEAQLICFVSQLSAVKR